MWYSDDKNLSSYMSRFLLIRLYGIFFLFHWLCDSSLYKTVTRFTGLGRLDGMVPTVYSSIYLRISWIFVDSVVADTLSFAFSVYIQLV